ncbi:hypothetical protein [Dokdonella sp.]|uniref:hypothetical protein n=1 Tax=Dokdonella sp. TaxID=2291710 RepID=UPI0027BAB277|nr:hypothetical protein [Dokdonella sp.]
MRHARMLLLIALALPLVAQAAWEPPIFADSFEGPIFADCDPASVQAALNAVPDGGTVRIRAGTCNWGNARLTWGGGSAPNRKTRVTVRGAGTATDGSGTVIKRNVTMTNWYDYMIEFKCGVGAMVELADFRVVGNGVEEDLDAGIGLTERCRDFRVHDMVFEKFSNAGLTVRGPQQRGVIHDNSFLSNFKCVPGCWGYGVAVYGDDSDAWPPLQLGTAEAVFVEDNYFYDNRHGIAANSGSVYVARHNLFVSTARTRDYGQIDAHGPSRDNNGVRHPGSRSWEIYDNEIHGDGASGNRYGDGIALRGGDGVIYNNKVKDYVPYAASLDDDDCSGSRPQPYQTTAAYIWSDHWSEDWRAIPGYNPDKVWIACPTLLEQGSDWHLDQQPPGYQAFPYPHPLRH